MDIYENPNEYVIKAELAGYDEGKINLYIEKHVLHIASGEKEEKHEDKDRKYLIRERAVRSFERSFTLPEDAAEENLTATYKHCLPGAGLCREAQGRAEEDRSKDQLIRRNG